ncbi:MAG: hypothetical protein NUV56_01655 [Candidatus Uhrbacteria bacterium]|nr:hypothetical protein [Candidatus Uhrbacteria bacterium]
MEEAVGVFLMLAGFIVGLGAVTVIDLHGFLGRKSPYWTEATIRTHKVTKPLIWLGMLLAIVGGVILYRDEPLVGVPLYHAIAAVILVLNGCFLSFIVSPELLRREKKGKSRELLPTSLQAKIMLSFLISFIGWWGSVFAFVAYFLLI